MKVYTRTGDAGTTSLVGGTRVAKNDARLEAYGTADELNSWLGLLCASSAIPDAVRAPLHSAMNLLFDIGAALATTASFCRADIPMRPAPISRERWPGVASGVSSISSRPELWSTPAY